MYMLVTGNLYQFLGYTRQTTVQLTEDERQILYITASVDALCRDRRGVRHLRKSRTPCLKSPGKSSFVKSGNLLEIFREICKSPLKSRISQPKWAGLLCCASAFNLGPAHARLIISKNNPVISKLISARAYEFPPVSHPSVWPHCKTGEYS